MGSIMQALDADAVPMLNALVDKSSVRLAALECMWNLARHAKVRPRNKSRSPRFRYGSLQAFGAGQRAFDN
jgi:hypothetical protein